ncbi:hypothetical protein J2W32_004430 [Variovorax boronicumulans]|uniref:KilA-N DNA-binding domain-containing protein n=1 Tax=Variovorax boronicumulans TaxID=436515 RepID=A0AAW8D5Q1_9BURK|nr:ORF6N domain-containing protein [Variovorax boronicumulans]MDP9895332.1 hypothetical protein [Variovorax boronicumulans]MDQ0055372.1 hypothetical protein [Variovorax boronicumulans]
MTNIVKINNTDLQVLEFHGQRVVTLAQADEVHRRPKGTARRNFNANKARLIDGEDYFVRNSSEAHAEFGIIAPNGLTLLAESGYLMLVKSFTDDLAWDVQRKLVNSYFRNKSEVPRIAYAVGSRDTLTKAEQDELRFILNAGAEALPLKQRGPFLMKGWSKLKAHFKVPYREIPRSEFSEALSIATRHAAEPTAVALPAPASEGTALQQALDSMHLMAGSVADLAAAMVNLTNERTAEARGSPPRRSRKVEAETLGPVSASAKNHPVKDRTSHVEG